FVSYSRRPDATGSPAPRRHPGRVRGVAGDGAGSAGRGRLSEAESGPPHAELRDRVAGDTGSDVGQFAPTVVPYAQREDGGGVGTGRHPAQPNSEGTIDGGRFEETRTRAQGSAGVSWRSAHRGAARHVVSRRSLSGVSARQSLPAERAGAAGAVARPGADCR